MHTNLTAIAAALAANGIPHGILHVHAHQNNTTITDGARVFCKVSRPGFSIAELQLELALANSYGAAHMLRPLHPQAIELPAGIMTVWHWEALVQLESAQATPDEGDAAAALLLMLHELPATGISALPVLTNFSFLRRKMDSRFAFAKQHGVTAADTAILDILFEEHLAGMTFPRDDSLVLNHGDPHFGNLVRRGPAAQLCYIDYESAQLAPPEFDMAAVRVNVALLGRNPLAWHAAVQRFQAGTRPVNWTYLDTFTLARMISMTAYGLLHPHAYATVQERIQLLETYHVTGHLPTHFSRLI